MNQNEDYKRPKPMVLIIMDGFGIAPKNDGNAISQAKMPCFKELIAKYPVGLLNASEEFVGLPDGVFGNSEVGHMNIGMGRVIYQDLQKIDKAIEDRSFFANEAFNKTIEYVKKKNSRLHLMGLVSDGRVHSSLDHLKALLELARDNNFSEVFIHCFLDGRDTVRNSAIRYIEDLNNKIAELKVGKIATMSGRFYAMDRDNHWERIKKAYMAMTEGIGNIAKNPIEALSESYKKEIYDEEFVPTVFTDDNDNPIAKIDDGDAIIFFNYRADRAREITKAFSSPELSKLEDCKVIKNLLFTGFTEYEKGLPIEVAFPQEKLINSFGEIISRSNLKQLRIAETEKYAHVTYFFNGGREEKSDGEDHVLIPSPRIDSYAMKPEMSAELITEKVIKEIDNNNYDFILINFANPDMVGHTGDLEATIKAVETVDKCLKKIVKEVLRKNGAIIITGDHGNADVKINLQTGEIAKEHTTNPVPFILVSDTYEGKNLERSKLVGDDLSVLEPVGKLADIAPTILKLLKIEKPSEMTGESLI